MVKKSILKSRLMNVGFWVSVLSGAQLLWPKLQQQIPADWYAWGGFAIGIAIIVLRYDTTQPVK